MVGTLHKVSGVDPITPVGIDVDRQALTQLLAVLGAPSPEEGCALLLGQRSAARWRLRSIWPCLNVWQPVAARDHRFALDPREQLQAQRWARAQGLDVLGAAHSHPARAPEPSATDRALTLAPTLMLIHGLPTAASRAHGPGVAPGLACWWLADTIPPETWQLGWRMVD